VIEQKSQNDTSNDSEFISNENMRKKDKPRTNDGRMTYLQALTGSCDRQLENTNDKKIFSFDLK